MVIIKVSTPRQVFPMMKRHVILVFVVILIFTSGCASMRAVPLERSFWQDKGKRVGIAMALLPKPELDVQVTTTAMILGRSFLQTDDHQFGDYAVIMHETDGLRKAFDNIEAECFDNVRRLFIQELGTQGFDAFRVDQPVDVQTLPRFNGGSDALHACRDYRDVGTSAGADYLIVFDIRRYGAVCRYIDLNNYGVDVFVEPAAEMIDVSSNRVVWRTGAGYGSLSRLVDASCDRPDHIPIILDSLHDALDVAGQDLVKDFFSGKDALKP